MAKVGSNLQKQIEKLRSGLTDEQVSNAQMLASESPDVVRYAFRILGQVALTKKEQETYDELVIAVGEDAANAWKTAKLASKTAS